MKESKETLLYSRFSHIYYEKNTFGQAITRDIFKKFPGSIKIPIGHYKDFFCRPGQDFVLQKKAQKLILASKNKDYLYAGSGMCDSFGYKRFFYTAQMLNCIYDCEYCFLQGMHPSGNIVAFINTEDFFDAVRKELEDGPFFLALSYDTDLLAFENIIPYCKKWIGFAADCPEVEFEIRTRSANYNSISDINPVDNVILAWSLSPSSIIGRHELFATSLDSRLDSIIRAVDDGWKVRLCFDPVLLTDNWKELYSELIKTVFKHVNRHLVYDVTAGLFRIPPAYLKAARKIRYNCGLLQYPYELRSGSYTYSEKIEEDAIRYINSLLEH